MSVLAVLLILGGGEAGGQSAAGKGASHGAALHVVHASPLPRLNPEEYAHGLRACVQLEKFCWLLKQTQGDFKMILKGIPFNRSSFAG